MNKKTIIGWGSAFLILIAYALLIMEILNHKSILYNCMNFFAGIGLAWRVFQDRNYSNFVLELVFILIAAIGVIKSI